MSCAATIHLPHMADAGAAQLDLVELLPLLHRSARGVGGGGGGRGSGGILLRLLLLLLLLLHDLRIVILAVNLRLLLLRTGLRLLALSGKSPPCHTDANKLI